LEALEMNPGDDPLRDFFGSYFHEDWNVEFEDDPALVKAFVADFGSERAKATERALREALSAMRSDEDAEACLRKWHSLCVPQAPADPPREWLAQIADLLAHEIRRQSMQQ
jgi:hypothetical protein